MNGDVTPSVTRSFASADEIDFGSSAGIQQLLSVVRGTPMNRGDYNRLRDLIFSYKQQGDAPKIKEEILSELFEVGLLTTLPQVSPNDPVSRSEDPVPMDLGEAKADVPSDVNPVPIKVIKDDSAEVTRKTIPVTTVTEEKADSSNKSAHVPFADRGGRARPKPSFGVTVKPEVSNEGQAAVVSPAATIAVTETPAEPQSLPVVEPGVNVSATSVSEPAQAEIGIVNESDGADVSINETGEEVENDFSNVAEPEPLPPEPGLSSEPSPEPEVVAEPEVPVEDISLKTESPVPFSGNPIDRIKAIKHEVNTLVGNPINLIDTDNEVGREYMNALLDAMKKANGGAASDMDAAMDRLEKAFVAVKSITNSDTNASAPDQAENEEVSSDEIEEDSSASDVADSEPAEQNQPIGNDTTPDMPVAPVVDPLPQSETLVSAVTQDPVNQSNNPVTPESKLTSVAEARQSIPSQNDVNENVTASSQIDNAATNEVSVNTQTNKPVPKVGLPKSRLFATAEPDEENSETVSPAPMPEIVQTDNGVAAPNIDVSPVTDKEVTISSASEAATLTTAKVVMPEIEANKTPAGFTSVAEEKAEQTEHIEHVMEEAAAEKKKKEAEISKMNPLMVPDITNGLNQLLSEWKLFKSSGIFGTGPSGAEHPLYKKLANLQMTAVVTGRFEGATPEIKQSITDYMNGWRYEEGIIHEHGETFENYLRRVIQKIIDKRKSAGKK